jgi:uncharacterized membrane protein YeaQ/YmgE (transglycosylase-associated protein family)
MNTKNLWIAALIGAVVTTFFANFPVINVLNCLVCLPFWGGPLLAVWFYKRQSGAMNMNQAIYVGLLAGFLAGALGFLFSLIGMAGAAGLVNQLNRYMPQDQIPVWLTGGTALLFTLTGVITNIIFGLIGGLIGGAIWQDKVPAVTTSPNQ